MGTGEKRMTDMQRLEEKIDRLNDNISALRVDIAVMKAQVNQQDSLISKLKIGVLAALAGTFPGMKDWIMKVFGV